MSVRVHAASCEIGTSQNRKRIMALFALSLLSQEKVGHPRTQSKVRANTTRLVRPPSAIDRKEKTALFTKHLPPICGALSCAHDFTNSSLRDGYQYTHFTDDNVKTQGSGAVSTTTTTSGVFITQDPDSKAQVLSLKPRDLSQEVKETWKRSGKIGSCP